MKRRLKKKDKSSKTDSLSVAVYMDGSRKKKLLPPRKPLRYKPPVKLIVPDHLPNGKRRAKNIRKNHTDDSIKLEKGKQYVLECTMHGYADADIGEAMGISQQRVSELREEAIQEEIARRSKLANKVRVLEEIRILRYMKSWDSAAMDPGNARAAEVQLRWIERYHKLLGIDVQKQEISGPNGGPIQNQQVADLSKLTDEELALMNKLMLKSSGEVVEGEVVVENADNKGTDKSS